MTTARSATFTVSTPGRGFTDVTQLLVQALRTSRVNDGVCAVSVMHTSASLIIFENADPTAKADIEAWMARNVRDGDPAFSHNDEGPDDMPSHIRSALTATTLTIPVSGGRMMLGRWQGVYLWEHRTSPHERTIAVACVGSSSGKEG